MLHVPLRVRWTPASRATGIPTFAGMTAEKTASAALRPR
jgi:hypothetical protein